MPGYDTNQFEGLGKDEEEEFTCGICQYIFKKPVVVPCCRQTYCEECINEWLNDHQTCPNDRSRLERNSLTQPPMVVLNLLAKLRIHCDYSSDGCDYVCRLERLSFHLAQECHYNPQRNCQSCVALKKQLRMNEDAMECFKIQCSEQQEIIDELLMKLRMADTELDKYRAMQSSETHDYDNEIIINHKVLSEDQKILVESLKGKHILKSLNAEKALLAVDRKLFCPTTPYADTAKSIGYGATISAPHMHAHILELVAPYITSGSVVLDIGSGSGYLTFCMAQIAGKTGKVIGIDHVNELIEKSRETVKNNFKYLSNVLEFITRDGRNGYPAKAPYDVINIGASVSQVSPKLLDQLKNGGRLVAPIGEPNDTQKLTTIDKLGNGSIKTTVHMNVLFGSLQNLRPQN